MTTKFEHRSKWAWISLVFSLFFVLFGCASNPIPDEAYQLPPSTLKARQVQTRIFEVSDETEILQAAVALLQDMEYNIDSVEYPLGILSASKVVDADDATQKALLISADVALAVLSILTGTSPSGSAYATADDKIDIKITFVVLPSLGSQGKFAVRATSQSSLITKSKRIKNVALIDDPRVYQEIFEKLYKSALLEKVGQ